MATFITTIKFTQQGIKGIDETTKRAATLKAAGKKMGVKVTDIYWTLGDHDGVLIFDAPDGEGYTKRRGNPWSHVQVMHILGRQAPSKPV